MNFTLCDAVRKFWIERKQNPVTLEFRLTPVTCESFFFTSIRIPSLVMVTYQIALVKSLVSQSSWRLLNQGFSEISNRLTRCSMSGFLKVFAQLLESIRKWVEMVSNSPSESEPKIKAYILDILLLLSNKFFKNRLIRFFNKPFCFFHISHFSILPYHC